jgi:hypothetical protein
MFLIEVPYLPNWISEELAMAISDHEYVNFSEDHEMNYHAKKVNKRETASNRSTLRTMGTELKSSLGKARLTHGEFHPYVNKNKSRLE